MQTRWYQSPSNEAQGRESKAEADGEIWRREGRDALQVVNSDFVPAYLRGIGIKSSIASCQLPGISSWPKLLWHVQIPSVDVFSLSISSLTPSSSYNTMCQSHYYFIIHHCSPNQTSTLHQLLCQHCLPASFLTLSSWPRRILIRIDPSILLLPCWVRVRGSRWTGISWSRMRRDLRCISI